MKTYVHIKRIEHLDYGSRLGTSWHIAWSHDGKAESVARGAGDHFATRAAAEVKLRSLLDDPAAKAAGIEVCRGEDVVRRCDMNPHGLM